MSDQPEALRLADELSRPWPRSSRQAAIELRRLQAEIEVLRADAERYRWLRTRVGVERENDSAYVWLPSGNTKIVPAETDAAIDAARSKT